MQKQSSNNSERLQLKTVSAEATAEDELIPNLVQSNVSKSKLVTAAVNYLDESEEIFYVHVSFNNIFTFKNCLNMILYF
jgi:hypothetical protein